MPQAIVYDLAHDRAFAGARQAPSSDLPLLHTPFDCKDGGRQLKDLLAWNGEPAAGGTLSSTWVDRLGGATDLTERRGTIGRKLGV